MKTLFVLFIFSFSSSIVGQDIVKRMWVEPYVITEPNETIHFNLELNNNVSDIDSLVIEFGNGQEFITFHDNGEGNDKTAGDNIYSSASKSYFLFEIDGVYPTPTAFSKRINTVTAYMNGVPEVQTTEGSFNIRAYTPAVLPHVKNVNPSFQYTSHIANIVDKDLEDIYQNRTEFTKQFYEVFPDDRHTLLISGTETSSWTADYLAASFTYTNDVEGIGIEDANDMFSSENLEQIIFFNKGSESNGVLFHELHHRWGISLPQEWKMSSGGHWAGANSLDGSGFGGVGFSRIESLGNNLYDLYYTELENFRFNSLDMYLAGYGSLDEVNFPIEVLPEFTFIADNPDGKSVRVSAEELITITKEEFISKLGFRNPSYAESRKTQNLAMVVRSQRLLTATELGYFHTIMEELEKKDNSIYSPNTYYDRTFEKGMLSTRIATFNSTETEIPNDVFFSKLYPNPASNYINIGEINSFFIMNTMGKVVMKQDNVSKRKLDISNLPTGTYMINYEVDDTRRSEKFLKY